jgi:hypothetical protein
MSRLFLISMSHCEEPEGRRGNLQVMDCFAALAMTKNYSSSVSASVV